MKYSFPLHWLRRYTIRKGFTNGNRPMLHPCTASSRGEETQRIERLSGLLRDAAAHPGSQRCRCGCGNGENDKIIVTPKGKVRKINQKGHVWSVGLGRMAELLPTPTARDWKGAASPESLEKRGRIPERTACPISSPGLERVSS